MRFSVIIPAHNEEKLIGGCLDSITEAGKPFRGDVEVIVAINRCLDRTEEIARGCGALVTFEDARNLAGIRNAGAKMASGDIIVTIDADSRMSPNALIEIDRALASGAFIGGGVVTRFERMSPGIFVTAVLIVLVMFPLLVWQRLSGGLFWCYRKDFEAIGGFDERLVSAEDIDFAKRLKTWGKKQGKRFKTLWHVHIITSCRKFDQLGDWYIVRNPRLLWTLNRGKDQEAAGRYYYDAR